MGCWLEERKNTDAFLKWHDSEKESSNEGEQKCHQVVLALASPLLKHAFETATDNSLQLCCCERFTSVDQTVPSRGCSVFDGCVVLAGASEKVVNSLVNFVYGKEVVEDKSIVDELNGWLKTLQVSNKCTVHC